MNDETQRRTNVSLLLIFGISGFVFATAGCGFLFFLWNSTAAQTVRAALRDPVVVGVTVIWCALVVFCVAGLILALYRLYASAEAAHNRARVIYHPQGVVPQVVGMNVSPAVALGREREMLALGMGADNTTFRIGSPAIREILKQTEPEGTLPEVDVELAPDEVVRPDFANKPVVGIVGQQGSGKSTLLYYLMAQYRRWAPDAEFIIMSTLPINWRVNTAITDPHDIYEAVMALDVEHKRRQLLAVEAGQHDWHRWPERPPETVVVVDELENAYDRMAAEGRNTAREFGITFRTLLKEGRNSGMAFVVASQTADGRIADKSFMASAGTLLLMRMMPQTAARFYEFDRDLVKHDLPNLPVGRAWHFNREAWVQFPYTERQPEVRLSNVYRPRLQLSRDAEADGIGNADMPDGIAVQDAIPVSVPPADPLYRQILGGVPIPVPEGEPSTYAPWLPSMVYKKWVANGGNLNETQRQMFGYNGGQAYHVTAWCVNESLRRRGRKSAYKG